MKAKPRSVGIIIIIIITIVRHPGQSNEAADRCRNRHWPPYRSSQRSPALPLFTSSFPLLPFFLSSLLPFFLLLPSVLHRASSILW